MKNYIANAIEIADLKAKYDSEAIKLLSDKRVLAWILKYSVIEVSDYTIDEIMAFIEDEIHVSEIPLYPGKKPESIVGISTSDKVPNEGEIFFDLRFHVRIPNGKHIKMLINIEAQKDFYPGYDIVTRAIFYCARMLSGQLDTEFSANNYDDIKKVYSIWICMVPPKHARNTITEYCIEQKKLYGDFGGKVRYDLMSAIIICLGKDENDLNGTQLHRMLNTLFSENISSTQKKEILQEEFNFTITNITSEGVDNMCNLSDLIEERAMKRGMQKGLEAGMEAGMEAGIEAGIQASIKNTIEILRDMNESNESILLRIISKFDVSREQVEKYL